MDFILFSTKTIFFYIFHTKRRDFGIWTHEYLVCFLKKLANNSQIQKRKILMAWLNKIAMVLSSWLNAPIKYAAADESLRSRRTKKQPNQMPNKIQINPVFLKILAKSDIIDRHITFFTHRMPINSSYFLHESFKMTTHLLLFPFTTQTFFKQWRCFY